MKKLSLVICATTLVVLASAARADVMPYFGDEPIRGSYWNGPQADYPYPAVLGYRTTGYGAYAQASCGVIRVRHVSTSGRVYYRTRHVCNY